MIHHDLPAALWRPGQEKETVMPATILIADDNRNIRTVVKMDLESQGYKVLEATNGREALDLARENKPDLVVLDVMMPEMDGFEVCFQLKKDELLRGIPVIMLTAKTTPSDKFLGREMGADEYLTKPFDPEDLEKRIERILAARKKGEQLHPLTGLPLAEAVRHEIERRNELRWVSAVMEGFLEEESFDIYRKKYGNIKADEAMKKTADILQALIATQSGLFLGQRGDATFVFVGWPGELKKVKSLVAKTMEELIPTFYDEQDKAAGGISLRGSNGAETKIGLTKWVWHLNDAA
jgi:DNA-binding response OmpR family regulator